MIELIKPPGSDKQYWRSLTDEQEHLLREIVYRIKTEGRKWNEIDLTEEQMREINTRDWFLKEA